MCTEQRDEAFVVGRFEQVRHLVLCDVGLLRNGPNWETSQISQGNSGTRRINLHFETALEWGR